MTGQAELVARARQGDQEAFEELVRDTYADTYTLAYRLTGNEEDARDVVQESYLRAYRGLKRFRGDAQFTTWLYRITANCANTHLGKRSRRRTEPLADDAPVADTDPERDPAARADATLLRDKLERRPRRPAAQAAVRRRAPRRLRPAPRGDRRRAGHLRVGGQGPAPPGPPQAARGGVPRPRPGHRHDDEEVRRCGVTTLADLLAGRRRRHRRRRPRRPPPRRALPALPGRARPVPQAAAGAAHLRTEVLEPAPGLLPEILASLEAAGERHALRSMLTGRRLAYAGGIAAATAAGAAGAILFATRTRKTRLAS